MLLRDWRAGAGKPVALAWLTVDDDDNDLSRFLIYLISALQTVHPGLGQEALALLETSEPLVAKVILAALLQNLSSIETPFVLAVDDFHKLHDQAIHEAMVFLIEHLPDSVRLVVLTRSDPPWPLARWRVSELLAEIRVDQLRFTQAETAKLLMAMGLSLSPDQVAAVADRTDGWAAALQLAGLAARSAAASQPASQALEMFLGNSRFVLDYLVSEVLNRQPAHIQRFLLETSILERLSAEVCDAVWIDATKAEPWPSSEFVDGELTDTLTGASRSQAILEYLASSNLFLEPLDDTGEWYRYHPLFADVLRHQLKRQSPQRLAELHGRASAWCQSHGQIDAAVQHALAAGDEAGAAAVIEAAANQPGHYPDLHTLRSWLRRLPEALIRSRPWLSLLQAQVCLFQGELSAVAERVQSVQRMLAAATEAEAGDRLQLAKLAVLRGFLANLTSSPDEGLAISHEGLANLPANDSLRVMAWLSIGIAQYLRADPEQATQCFEETRRVALELGDPYRAEVATAYLGQTRWLQGRRTEAERLYREGLALFPERARAPSLNGLYAGLSMLLYQRNELGGAAEAARRSLALAEEEGNKLVLVGARLCLANICLAEGAPADGREYLNQALRLAEQEHILWLWMVPSLAAAQVHWWLRAGDVAAASAWAKANPVATSNTMEQRALELARARVSLAEGNAADALSRLQALKAAAEAAGCCRTTFEAQMLVALALHQQGQSAAALLALEPALAWAEAEGCARIWLDEGPAMQRLLAEWHTRRGQRAVPAVLDYVIRLLAVFQSPQSPQVTANQRLPEPLSQRELEILRLMAEGQSNADIAHRLVLSVTTVKKHGTNLFGKLGSTGRAEAVARARELGLLP